MVRLLCAPLAQHGSGGASSLGCAQECERGALFIIFNRGRGGREEVVVGGCVTNCPKDLLFFVMNALSYAEGREG